MHSLYIYFSVLILAFSGFLMISCDNMTRPIDIDLPEVERELVVECYLEAGQPYRVLLTETKGYFDDLNDCPIIKGATVIITHNGVVDTLEESFYFSDECTVDNFFGFIPYFNADRTRFYNYGSTMLCPLDYDNDFELKVIDNEGNRQVSATTRFIPPVTIDSSISVFDEEGEKAYGMFFFEDDANTVDFYRITMHETSLTQQDSIQSFIEFAADPAFDNTIDDARFFNGETIAWGTPYDYEEGDTLIATVYSIDQVYHDYLETLFDAQAANGNPFSQPGQILTPIEGGQGIFTTLSYDRDTIIIYK